MAELLKKMSEINAVSGNENDIRNLIIAEIKDKVDDITVDTMGNVIAYKKGSDSGKKIAVAVNMDEPGFIISGVTEKGYLKFKAVGNIDPRKIISKRVVIGADKIKGVIGMKAIHLQTKSERENVVAVSKLFIDIGAKDKEDAEKYVKLGDYVTFDTEFMQIGSNVKGKALDRSGICTSLINAIGKEYKYDTYMCFLVQREVGARGAKIVSHRINADVILSVSSAETADMYGCESNAGVKLGDGSVVNFADRTIIADKEITEKMIKAAKKAKIKVQPQVLMPQTSDGGAMQSGADGAICLSSSVPCRYSHSPVSVMSLDDINSMTGYIRLFLNKIGEMI